MENADCGGGTSGRADGDDPSGARDLRRTLNIGHWGKKYFGKSVPELVDRYAHFDGFSAVISGFLMLRLSCNRFYFVNLADHWNRPPVFLLKPGEFTISAYIICVVRICLRAVAARG
jgi:hypothetical protein